MIDRLKSWLGARMLGEAPLDLEAEMNRFLSGGFAEFVLETVIGEGIRKPGGYHYPDARERDVEKVMDSFRHNVGQGRQSEA